MPQADISTYCTLLVDYGQESSLRWAILDLLLLPCLYGIGRSIFTFLKKSLRPMMSLNKSGHCL